MARQLRKFTYNCNSNILEVEYIDSFPNPNDSTETINRVDTMTCAHDKLPSGLQVDIDDIITRLINRISTAQVTATLPS